MADKQMGPKKQFPYTLEQLEQRFEQYKQETREDTILFPCIQDFFDRNNISMEEANDTANNPADKNRDIAKYLKRIVDWHFNQLFTNPNWVKRPVNAIYLSKQKVCGYGYTDKTEVKQDTKMDISVSFGSKAKNPGK